MLRQEPVSLLRYQCYCKKDNISDYPAWARNGLYDLFLILLFRYPDSHSNVKEHSILSTQSKYRIYSVKAVSK